MCDKVTAEEEVKESNGWKAGCG